MPCPVKQALPLLVRTMMMSTMARACCTIHDNPCVHVHVSMVNDEVNSDERSVKPPVHFNVDSGASVHCPSITIQHLLSGGGLYWQNRKAVPFYGSKDPFSAHVFLGVCDLNL